MRTTSGRVLSLALASGIVAVTASTLLGEHGLRHLRRLQGERRELAQSSFMLLQRNSRLRDDIDRLRSDDLYLEELARRELGLVRPNETVYRVRPPG